jgi:predicted deacylase
MFLPDVKIGDFLEEGQRIGEMQNLRGEVLATFTAPLTGVVLMMFTTPVRSSGDTILIMGKTED